MLQYLCSSMFPSPRHSIYEFFKDFQTLIAASFALVVAVITYVSAQNVASKQRRATLDLAALQRVDRNSEAETRRVKSALAVLLLVSVDMAVYISYLQEDKRALIYIGERNLDKADALAFDLGAMMPVWARVTSAVNQAKQLKILSLSKEDLESVDPEDQLEIHLAIKDVLNRIFMIEGVVNEISLRGSPAKMLVVDLDNLRKATEISLKTTDAVVKKLTVSGAGLKRRFEQTAKIG